MKPQNLDMARGSIGSLLFKMSMPSITAMLLMTLYGVTDIYWVSKVSPEAMAALTLSMPLQIILSAVAMGSRVGASSFAARMFGAGKAEEACKAAGQCCFISILLGAVTIYVGTIHSEGLLRLFGTPAELVPLAKSYLSVFVLGSPFMFFAMLFSALFKAEGNPNLSYLVVLTSLLCAVADPFLILGWGPFPRLGLQGAAASNVSGNCIIFLFTCFFLFAGGSKYKIKSSYLLPDVAVLRHIYRVGLPAFITALMASFVYIVFNHVLAGYGSLAIATFGLLSRIAGVCVWVLFGIGNGVMPLVAYSEGAKLHGRVVEFVRTGVRVSLLIGIVYSLLMEVFARPILILFTNNDQFLEMAVWAMRISFSTLGLAGPIIVWVNMFYGLGKGFIAMIFPVSRELILLIPLLIILPAWFGFHGVWFADPVSIIVTFVVLWYYSRRVQRGFGKELVRKAA